MTDAASGRSDEELLSDHVAGDPYAFGELVRRHRDRLWAVALRTLGDREDAADAVQDALLSAYRAAGRFRGDSAITTWLHRIVVNACLDRIRRRQARPTVPLPEVEVEPREPGPDREAALDVRSALAELSADQRAALVLVDIEGYGVAEAAQILGVAEGTVKSRCARGRARLAVLLGYLRTGEPGPDQPAGNQGPTRRVPSGIAPAPGGRVPEGRVSGGGDESAVSNATEAGT